MPSFITPKNSIKKQHYKKFLHNSFIQSPLKKDIQNIKVRLNFQNKFYLTLNLPSQMTIKQLLLIVKNLLTLHHKYGRQQNFVRIELDESQQQTFYKQQISKNVFDYLLEQQELKLAYFCYTNNQDKTSKLNIKIIYGQDKNNATKNSRLSYYKLLNGKFDKQYQDYKYQSDCLVLNRLIKFSDMIQITTYNKKTIISCPKKLINSFSKIEKLFQIRNLLIKCSQNYQSQIFSNQLTQIFNNQSGFYLVFDQIPLFYLKSTLKNLYKSHKQEGSKFQNLHLKVQILSLALNFCQIICFIQKNIANNMFLSKIALFKNFHFDKFFKFSIYGRICIDLSYLSQFLLHSLFSETKLQKSNQNCLEQWYNQFMKLLIYSINSCQFQKQIIQIIQKVQAEAQQIDLALSNKDFKKQNFSSVLLRLQAQILNLKAKIFQISKILFYNSSKKQFLSLSTIYQIEKLDKLQNKKNRQLKTMQHNIISQESNHFLFYYLLKKDKYLLQKSSFLSQIFKFQRKTMDKVQIQKDSSINIYNKSTQKKVKKLKKI